MPVIQRKIDKKSTLYTDKWKAYDGLVFNGYKHKRINHSKEMVDKNDHRNHINGIENFWGWCKNRSKKFNGLEIISISTSKNVSSDLITEMIIYMLRYWRC